MKKVLIHHDYVHNNYPLWRLLCSVFGSENVDWIDSGEIVEVLKNHPPTLLVLPGGASRYRAEKLYNEGNNAIKEYVAEGGKCLGVCGGAYYMCAHTNWLENHEKSIVVPNQLAFFSGTAKGPIPEFTTYGDEIKTARIVTLSTSDGRKMKTLYWGGPLFLPFAEQENRHKILARYTDLPGQPAAMVAGSYGKGCYLLTSPHLEVDGRALSLMQFNVRDNTNAELTSLERIDDAAKTYFAEILQKFITLDKGISCL